MRPHLLLACVLLAVTSITSEVVFAQTNCPSSCLRFVDHPEVCSSRAAVDSIYSQCASGGCGGGHVKYELASGEVAANAAE